MSPGGNRAGAVHCMMTSPRRSHPTSHDRVDALVMESRILILRAACLVSESRRLTATARDACEDWVRQSRLGRPDR
jgi:hypothetical protein